MVLGCIRDATAGTASTLLVRGEPGVGKTSLVTEVCRAAKSRVETLWAQCLPLTSMNAPLLPLREVLRRARLAEDVTLPVFDAWLDTATADRPMVLVVDDLQWADRSTLDVLLYVIAGRPDRGLVVIATVRAGAEGEWLSSWLADVRRLPRVRELVLDRLDRARTGEQVGGIFGRPPDERLVDDVHTRTNGNPYLTELLVRNLDPSSTRLPPWRPSDLRDAVVQPWRRMSARARDLTLIVAVGGKPRPYDDLARVLPALGFAGPALPALEEAVAAEVLQVRPDETFWFTHPLLAEMLVADLLPEQQRQLHGAWAANLDGAEPVDLADHYAWAEMTEPAFRWALRAAASTARPAERLRLFRRALSLWADITDPGIAEAELWECVRAAAEQAGLDQDQLEAIEALVVRLPPDGDDLLRGRLTTERAALRFEMGYSGPDVGLRRTAVEITASSPNSPEHAIATAELALGMMFEHDPDGVTVAAAAIKLAETCGDDEALAEALVAAAYAELRKGRPDAARAAAAQAGQIAIRLRRYVLFKLAIYAAANVSGGSHRETAEIFGRGAEELTNCRAPHSHVAEMCAWEADLLMWAGDWRRCQQRLRVALGARPGRRGDARARVTAARLACLQGRQAEAEGHIARAEEIFPVHRTDEMSLLQFHDVKALIALAAGDAERAFNAAVRSMERDGWVEDMLPIAARALADLAEARIDSGRDPAPVLARLSEFRRRYPEVIADLGAVLPEERRRAFQALADAETARAAHDPAGVSLWRVAADACHEGGQPWDEAYACWRMAQAALRDRRNHRDVPEALRRAHRLAEDLAAGKLRDDIERMARSARVDLTPAERPTPAPPDLPGLTVREREVLGHLLTGGTNAEIAKILVLSEKTIGVHISNMLRKTGTTNRIELAELARRHQAPDSEEHNGRF